MNISIFGLGYVGCVSLGCLAQNGHNVIGVDVSEIKVNQINDGIATIVEKDIDKIIKEQPTFSARTRSHLAPKNKAAVVFAERGEIGAHRHRDIHHRLSRHREKRPEERVPRADEGDDGKRRGHPPVCRQEDAEQDLRVRGAVDHRRFAEFARHQSKNCL